MNARREAAKTDRRNQLCERFAFVRDHLFNGRTREMARHLNVTHSVISKVCRGQQGPGDQLLARLSDHPRVNTRWLLEGIGDPLLPVTSGTLPVSNAILPGPPGIHRGMLSGERYPVAADLERDSRYWLRQADDLPNVSMLAGDLLLVETDSDQLARLDLVHRKLCAVTICQDDTPIFVLASVFIERGKMRANFLVRPGSPLVSTEPPKRKKPPRRRIGRLKGNDEGKSAGGKARRPDVRADTETIIGIEDIVGLVLLLERRELFASPAEREGSGK